MKLRKQQNLPAMEAELESLVKVTALTATSMAYARYASSTIPAGKSRLLALLPVVILLASLPCHFSTFHLRLASFFFHAWLATFKLLLLSFGSGPLSPSLPLVPFIAVASLPVKLRPRQPNEPSSSGVTLFILPSALKVLILKTVIFLYRFKHQVPSFLLLIGYNLHLYLSLDLVLSSSAFAAGCLLGVDLDPQFRAPIASSSLQDFWGRRWNLMAADILRLSVYGPVRSRWGPHAGAVAAFAVSGAMHEVLLGYLGVGGPRGEAFSFFLLQGMCTAAEMKARRAGWGWPRPALAALFSIGFVMVTSWWLLLPPLIRSGVAERAVEESAAAMGFFVDGAAAGLRYIIWGREGRQAPII